MLYILTILIKGCMNISIHIKPIPQVTINREKGGVLTGPESDGGLDEMEVDGRGVGGRRVRRRRG